MLEKLLFAINDCAWAYNITRRAYIFISPNIFGVLGITAEDLEADKDLWYSMAIEDDQDMILKATQDLETSEWIELYYRIRINNQIKWIFEKKTLFVDAATQDEIVLSVIKDVSDQNAVTHHLTDSLGDFSVLFDSSHNPMWIYELPSLRILKVNTAAIEHYGFSNEEFLSMTIRDVRPKIDLAAFNEYIFRTGIVKGLVNGYNPGGTWRHQNKNGDMIYAEITGHEIKYNNSFCRVIVATDVTERVHLQEQLAKLQELNNPG